MNSTTGAKKPGFDRATITLLIVAGFMLLGIAALLWYILTYDASLSRPAAPRTTSPEVAQATATPVRKTYSLAEISNAFTHHRLTLTWRDLNDDGTGQYDWSVIDEWLAAKAPNQPWALHVNLYPARGQTGIPSWVEKGMTPAYWTYFGPDFPDGLPVPNYRDPVMLSSLRAFVLDLGSRYDSQPALALVVIGVGIGGSMAPEREIDNLDLRSWYGEVDPIFGQRLSGCDWVNYLEGAFSAYASAFRRTPIAILSGEAYGVECRHWSEEHPYLEITTEAGAVGRLVQEYKVWALPEPAFSSAPTPAPSPTYTSVPATVSAGSVEPTSVMEISGTATATANEATEARLSGDIPPPPAPCLAILLVAGFLMIVSFFLLRMPGLLDRGSRGL